MVSALLLLFLSQLVAAEPVKTGDILIMTSTNTIKKIDPLIVKCTEKKLTWECPLAGQKVQVELQLEK